MLTKLGLFAILLAATTQFSSAATNLWTGGGPEAGSIDLLVQAPSAPEIIYAVSDVALFGSTDVGASWALRYEYQNGEAPLSMAVSRSNPNVIYSSRLDADVLKSTNGGRSWTPLRPNPDAPGSTYRLVTLGGQPDSVLAGLQSPLTGEFKGLFASTDGGLSWTAAQLSSVAFDVLAAGPDASPDVYGIGFKSGDPRRFFYRSTDRGATWEGLNFPGSSGTRLLIDPAKPKTHYVVDSAGHLYRTEDSGANWTSIQGPIGQGIFDAALAPPDSGALYASTAQGVFKSTDAGGHWQSQSATRIDDLIAIGQTALLGTSNEAISRSTDEGQTWHHSASGLLRLAWVNDLYASQQVPGVAWASVNRGLWKTTDGARTWTLINDSVRRLGLCPLDPRIMFSWERQKIRKSTDEGQTWFDLPKKLYGDLDVRVDPHSSDVVYLSDFYWHYAFPMTGWWVTDHWRSTDGGYSWEQAYLWPLGFDPDTAGVFWANLGGKLVKTTDGGASYTVLNAKPFFGPILVDPSNTEILYAVNNPGLLKSTNGGHEWSTVGLEEFRVTSLAIDPLFPATLLAGVEKQIPQPPGGPYAFSYSLYRSDDGGLTWQEFNQGIGDLRVDVVAFGPNQTAFAGAQPGGVYFIQLDDSLLFPRLTSDAGGLFTGFAIANVSGADVDARLHAYDVSGAMIGGPVDLAISPGQQWSSLAGSLLGEQFDAAEREGWVRMAHVPVTAAAFFSFGAPDLSSLDTADAAIYGMRHFVFPEIRSYPAVTRLYTANPNPEAATVSFQLRDGSGSPVLAAVSKEIAGSGVLIANLDDLFPGLDNQANRMYLDVSSSLPVVPFEELSSTGHWVAGLNGQDTGALRLYCPQYAFGPDVRSAVSVINLDDFAGTISLRLLGEDGVQIGQTVRLPIEAFGKLYLRDPSVFAAGLQATTGYLEITSDGPRLTGSVVFGDPSDERFASALPLQPAGAKEQIYSHLVSSADFFTGVALVNPGTSPAIVSIQVFDRDGQRVGSKTQTIDPGKKVSRLLTEYCEELSGRSLDSGYIKLMSDQEIVSYALFGAFDLRFLAAIQGRKH